MAVARPPDVSAINDAARALREGRLVVFPTETVYGLGANALDAAAVSRIFAAKGRPADNPLIVHVFDASAAKALARAWPARARLLAERFWPGPLTLVLPRAPGVPDATTAGLDSVALRVPAHPVARELLRVAGVPVAAPSANRSGRPSPTRVAHALEDLGDAVEVYLDGGATDVGLESTVVSLLEDVPRLLRPGGVTREQLEAALGEAVAVGRGSEDAVRSPGMKYRHYAPEAEVVLASAGELRARAEALARAGLRVLVIAARETDVGSLPRETPGARAEHEAWARQIFELLREADAQGYDAVVVEALEEAGLGAAIMNRLRKAAART